ncbi:MAG: Nramp family divalent metal transporter [Candidatus Hydrogenedentes bacterium]|nr:Nramp family divalent metal transporter [Candidatus Hydrogenedentota bacterium]
MSGGRKNPVVRLLAVLGPGLFLIGYNIGTGSVTTMASAGSRWGMSLTWTVVLSCICTYFGMLMFGRYTLVTGDTILCAVRRRLPYGDAVAMFLLLAVTIAEFASITGLSAICVDLAREWIRYASGYDNRVIKAAITIGLSLFLLAAMWRGSYAFLENLLAILVALMGLSFVITAILLVPSWRDILVGFVPTVPHEPNAALIVSGMAGTTFSSAILYCRSIILKQRGWTLAEKKPAARDAVVAAVAMFVLSIAVMVCAAGTLYLVHQPVEEAVQMVQTLEPLAGKFAITVFVVGILGAGISSLIPTILIGPWLIADYTNTPINPRSPSSRALVVVGVLIALGAPYLPPQFAKPVFIMILTMALLAVIVPVSTIVITVLLNQKDVMKEHRNSAAMNFACVVMIVFSIVMSYYAVIGLRDYVHAKFPGLW